MMLVTAKAECAHIDLSEAFAVSRGVRDCGVAQLLSRPAVGHQICSRLEEVDRKPWVEAMPDVQPLRDRIEGKGDQSPVERARLARVLEGSLQQRIADSSSLMLGSNKQLRQKPEAAANPAEREACNFSTDLRHPQAVRIILERERLKFRWSQARHRSEAVTDGEIVD